MVIRCEYCGTEFNSRKGNCPNCGAASGGNSDIERAKQQDEEALKTFRKIAAADFGCRGIHKHRFRPLQGRNNYLQNGKCRNGNGKCRNGNNNFRI